MADLKVGEKGVTIRVETGFDLTGVSAARLILEDPANSKSEVTANMPAPLTQGFIEFVTDGLTFQIPGEWTVIAEADATGRRLKTDRLQLLVKGSPVSTVPLP